MGRGNPPPPPHTHIRARTDAHNAHTHITILFPLVLFFASLLLGFRLQEKWVIAAELGPSEGHATNKDDAPMPWQITSPWKVHDGGKRWRKVVIRCGDCARLQ